MNSNKYTIILEEPVFNYDEYITKSTIICDNVEKLKEIVLENYGNIKYTIDKVEDIKLYEKESDSNELIIDDLDFIK